MNVKPILFNTDMVRGLLKGRKTVTRRVVKPHHLQVLESPYFREHPETPDKVLLEKLCDPPYRPGDILYVRETWTPWTDLFDEFSQYIYRADYPEEALRMDDDSGEVSSDFPACVKWHPSIHMPREAARIFLRVTDVRVERLHEITLEEMRMEGVTRQELRAEGCSCAWKTETCMDGPCLNRTRYEYSCWLFPFVDVWDSTIRPGTRFLYGWLANPWVWVIEFERISREEATP